MFANNVEFDFEREIFNNWDDKIVGGNDTTIENHPHQVSLRRSNSHYCGGSILTPNAVLTAGHCLQPGANPSIYTVMAGSTLRLGDANAQIRPVSRFLRHQQYNPSRISNDVGLVHFEQALVFGSSVFSVAIPAHNSAVPYGVNCNVTGWGVIREGAGSLPNILQVVTKPTVSNEECNKAYGGRITDDMMCAGLPEGGKDACQGDSGGPLVVNGVLLGVVSWGRGCARPGFPGVYSRVPFFTNWIQENLA
jgi:trypsin